MSCHQHHWARLAAAVAGSFVLSASSLPVGAPIAAAADKPAFKAPFECNLKVTYSTYSVDHGPNALDFIRADGKEDIGTPILASAGGTVADIGAGDTRGRYVVIDHGDGWSTEYLHLDSQAVEEGDSVKQGQKIGELGWTGDVDPPDERGAHLHFEQALDGENKVIEFDGQSLAPYPPEYSQEFLTSTNACDGQEPPAGKLGTALMYSGPASVSNGAPVQLSATLSDEDEKAVAQRGVSFALGAGESPQQCAGTTNAEGEATCTTSAVEQPLTTDATVPLVIQFAGDDAYQASEASTELKLQYVSGRAIGVSGQVPLLGLPISIDPTPDTGEVRTAGEETTSPPCAQSVDVAALLTLKALCAELVATTGPSTMTATASVQDSDIGVPGLPLLSVEGARSTSTSSCEGSSGGVDLTLEVAGTPVEVSQLPNQEIALGVAGTRLVVNEQTGSDGGGLTVNALHLTAPGGIDLVLASATTTAHNCT